MGNIVLPSQRAGFYRRYAAVAAKDIPPWTIADLTTKHSTLPGRDNGIFAAVDIAAGEIFGSTQTINVTTEAETNIEDQETGPLKFVDSRDILFAIDPLLNLSTLLDCHSAVDLYHRLGWVCRDYHDEDKADRLINFVLTMVPQVKPSNIEDVVLYAKARRPVAAGEEFFRCHGFSAWLRLGSHLARRAILPCLNLRNIVGFIAYLREWVVDTENMYDPLKETIKDMVSRLEYRFGYLVRDINIDGKTVTAEDWDRYCADMVLPQETDIDFQLRVLEVLFSARHVPIKTPRRLEQDNVSEILEVDPEDPNDLV